MAGLWDALKQYIGDALPGGALNPETAPVAKQANYLSGILDPASQVSQDATNWHKRTQNGLMDQLAGRDTPEAEQAYQTMMMAAGMAPIGMTAWHGSPHKFDKFDLSKIGTGEGAQAYGHGLYLAESPAVANEYAAKLGKPELVFGGKPITQLNVSQEAKDAAKWIESRAGAMSYGAQGRTARDDFSRLPEKIRKELGNVDLFDGGNLYKTDIPDEAVARFLDWDKPLSQQAPEVQAVARQKLARQIESASKPAVPGDGWGDLSAPYDVLSEMTGKDLVFNLRPNNNVSLQNLTGGGGPEVSDALRKAGIPGIRYLDGGSRSAGQGSSNFVAFDPEMIRILERNGQATGLQPWKPGEWKR